MKLNFEKSIERPYYNIAQILNIITYLNELEHVIWTKAVLQFQLFMT